jgi:hypothetical protein
MRICFLDGVIFCGLCIFASLARIFHEISGLVIVDSLCFPVSRIYSFLPNSDANVKKSVPPMMEIVFSHEVPCCIIVTSIKITSTNTEGNGKIPFN